MKDDIQGNGTVCRFDSAHVCPADVHQLRKPALGQTLFLAIIGYIQPQLFVFFTLLVFHTLTPV